MFRLEGGRPGDRRGFLHKSAFGKFVGGAVTGLVKRTPIGAAITTGVGIARSIIKRPARPVAPRTATARPTFQGAQGKEFGRSLKFGEPGGGFQSNLPIQPFAFGGIPKGAGGGTRVPCDFPMEIAPDGSCREPTVDRFGRPLGVGEAVMGQFGAALEPGVKVIERSTCLPGMQLGKDGLCYNKGAITNSQRMWPRGRRPLLTGGDLGAIAIASRAANKLERTTKRLRALGMMKPLPKGRSARHPALRIPVHKSVDV